MKKLLILLVALVLIGCEIKIEEKSFFDKEREREFNTVCIDGVEYLYYVGYKVGFLAPHFKTDGKLYLCGE